MSEVFKRAEELQLCYQDIESLTDIEAYRRFFPERYQSEILYDAPNYDDIHKELQRVGVTLKILWQEYVDRCRTKESIAVGYSKFCDDYQKHIAKYRLTNHLTHKPGVTVQVDWGKCKASHNSSRIINFTRLNCFLNCSSWFACQAFSNASTNSPTRQKRVSIPF